MMTCNYNGWADVPEDEREDLEAFEDAQALQDWRASVLPLTAGARAGRAQGLRPLSPPVAPRIKAA